MLFLFARWYMLVSWRVFSISTGEPDFFHPLVAQPAGVIQSTNETEPFVVDARVAGSVAICVKRIWPLVDWVRTLAGFKYTQSSWLERQTIQIWDGLPAANDFVPAVVNGRQMADGQVLTYDYFGHTWRSYRICYRPKDRNCEPVDLAINCFVSTSLLARFNGNTRSDRPCRADCVVENPVSWSDGRMIFLCDFCRFQLYTTPENEGCFFFT